MFTAILWFVAHRIFACRSDTHNELFALLGDLALFLFYDGCYADVATPAEFQVLAVLVAQLATPSLVPLIIMYLRKLSGTYTHHPLQMLWLAIPVALLTSSLMLFFMVGAENLAVALNSYYANGWSALEPYRGTPLYIFFISTFRIYHIVNYCLIAWLLIYLIVYRIKGRFRFGTILRFFFKGGEIETRQLLYFNITVVFLALVAKTPIIKDFVNTHGWFMALFAFVVSIFVFCFCVVALFSPKRTIRLSEITYGWRYNYGEKTKAEVTSRMLDSLLDDAEEDALLRAQEKIGENLHLEEWKSGLDSPEMPAINQHIFAAVGQTWEEDSLVPKFQKLMMDEQLFLQPSLTLNDVAERMGTNKTYVSKLVNNAYNVGFPELINTLRVDYAEQYILANPDAKQMEIAEKCGFLSASSFNNVFKKVTGMTPNIWKASIERAEHQTKK